MRRVRQKECVMCENLVRSERLSWTTNFERIRAYFGRAGRAETVIDQLSSAPDRNSIPVRTATVTYLSHLPIEHLHIY